MEDKLSKEQQEQMAQIVDNLSSALPEEMMKGLNKPKEGGEDDVWQKDITKDKPPVEWNPEIPSQAQSTPSMGQQKSKGRSR